ncbi:MAG: hypothetical protein MUF29_06650 [Chitinophagaceae bacterium]|nr:hypothetical protein [Chitinophagaceae bacterium]
MNRFYAWIRCSGLWAMGGRFLLLVLLAGAGRLQAQEPGKPVTTILLPLHLDSLYQLDQYKFGNNIPRFTLPYLEFFNGVQYAADSLRREGVPAHIQVVDTRQAGLTLAQVLQQPKVKQSSLLIAVAQSGAEIKLMSDFARMQQIPLISATYPNDGGVRETPQLYLANSTLRTHCYGIYNYLQQNHALHNLVVFTRRGTVEPYLKNWLEEAGRNTRGYRLPLKFITLTDSFQVSQVEPMLDSTRRNVVLGATLDTEFGKRLVRTLSGLQPAYSTLVMGMPTWDEIDLRHPEFKGMEVTYSTPFVSLSTNVDAYNSFASYYQKNLNSRPSDMALKGFEFTYRFVKTITRWPQADSFAAHINDRLARIFCDFNFQSVSNSTDKPQTDYFENKKLYFIRKADGVVKGIY